VLQRPGGGFLDRILDGRQQLQNPEQIVRGIDDFQLLPLGLLVTIRVAQGQQRRGDELEPLGRELDRVGVSFLAIFAVLDFGLSKAPGGIQRVCGPTRMVPPSTPITAVFFASSKGLQ